MKQVQRGGDNCHMVQIGGDRSRRDSRLVRWLKSNWLWTAFLLAVAVLLSIVTADMVLEASADVDYVIRCEQVGGHALNINHDPLCVSEDGRVIEP